MYCDLLDFRKGHCQWCSKKLQGKQKRWCSRKCGRQYTANHRWTQARNEAKKKAAHYLCDLCGEYVKNPDVDHIEPCKGKHDVWGCHHHQDNLRVLCKPCHKEVTRSQHKAGLFK